MSLDPILPFFCFRGQTKPLQVHILIGKSLSHQESIRKHKPPKVIQVYKVPQYDPNKSLNNSRF